MITAIAKKLFGTRNDRVLRAFQRKVNSINELEPSLQALSDEALRAKTSEFKDRLAAGEGLNDLLIEAFAVVREASVRVLGMRHFDVQLIGGMVLHEGNIAEMRTGEGKTLCSTLPTYLHALEEKGVHLVTVNDYLAERDANWMRPLYEFLDLSVGINLASMSHEQKKVAYQADITYGTNNEFGFDYLRDNMVFELDQRVQRSLNFAVIDEVDSILIDEARTPLIISGEADKSQADYKTINSLIPQLVLQTMAEGQKEDDLTDDQKQDYTIDEKTKQAYLTEKGHEKIEKLLVNANLMNENESLYDLNNIMLMHYVNAALRANALYQRDVDYVVKNDQIIIVDEHTGRLMDGRRWSDGLHQAIEAKENVSIQVENQTLADITFQNYFRMYKTLSGMTGTADTEAFELRKIYNLEVIVIPTNKPMIRRDNSDQVYLNQAAKYKAVLEKIKEVHKTKQPILVGTASIESSEYLSSLLKKEKVPHQVLNAKQHGREAGIIAEAGRLSAVTIATNMAGRGTDIVLGGSLEAQLTLLKDKSEAAIDKVTQVWKEHQEEVKQLGGLCVLATERHESRRIDNQLRGRSGRQGDPGESYFYLSMEDNLMRIFASDKMTALMQRFGFTEEDVIENKMITNAIEKAQRRVEGHNYDIRKHLLEYDDVANDQRGVIYEERLKLLSTECLNDTIAGLREDAISFLLSQHIPPNSIESDWDQLAIEKQLKEDFNLVFSLTDWFDQQDEVDVQSLQMNLIEQLEQKYVAKWDDTTLSIRDQIEKAVMIQILDQHWKEHLAAMNHLRQGIGLRSYAQKNPTQEYKKESFTLFENMLDRVGYEITSTLIQMVLREEENQLGLNSDQPQMNLTYTHHVETSMADPEAVMNNVKKPIQRNTRKVGRNESCPCGSQKKFKSCCGKIMEPSE